MIWRHVPSTRRTFDCSVRSLTLKRHSLLQDKVLIMAASGTGQRGCLILVNPDFQTFGHIWVTDKDIAPKPEGCRLRYRFRKSAFLLRDLVKRLVD